MRNLGYKRGNAEQYPGAKLLRMGIGDVSLPLCDAVIKVLHEAVYEAFIEDEILPHRGLIFGI